MSITPEREALVPQEGYTPVHKGVHNESISLRDDEVREASSVLTWDDQFFQNEDDIIAVFDFDYALMEDFNTKVQWAAMLFPPWCIISTIFACQPCFLKRRVQWQVYSQHVAITRDGIRFVRDKRKTLWGCQCTDAGRESKTIPFDKITDCDILEPAGNTCICITNVLATVNVDTASSGGVNQDGVVKHELTISGLKDPYAFKKLVWAMKRSNGEAYHATVARSGTEGGAPQLHTMMRGSMADGGGMAVSSFGAEVPELLREIRDELREHTKLLKAKQGNTEDVAEGEEKEADKLKEKTPDDLLG